MSSATLPLRDRYANRQQPVTAANEATAAAAAAGAPASAVSASPAVAGGASAAAIGAGFATSYFDERGAVHWLRSPGAVGTGVIHAAALLAIWGWSSGAVKPPLAPPVMELIRIQAEPRPELTPPKPEPVKDKQIALAPPKPAAPQQPVPRTVAAPAAQAETYTPPEPPAQVAPPGPVTPVQPAPAAQQSAPPTPPAAAPRQISTEGIPTDYVNQVYNRINRNADYPREAKMRHQQGKVGYRLTLNPDGSLLSFDIQSSGVDALDQAARDAIRRAAPFPRLPDLGGSSYLLAGNIVFKIN